MARFAQFGNALQHVVRRTDTLRLLPGKERNWEALAVLEGRGVLLATDYYPGTLLGFVPFH